MNEVMLIDTMYSPDDGGYYAEVFGRGGQTEYTTQICDSRIKARRLAEDWVHRNCFVPHRKGHDF